MQYRQGRSRIISATFTAPIAATPANIKAATATSSAAATVITTFAAQPDVPRVVSVTAGGTAGDIKAVSVVVEGTNTWGQTITETLPAFTVDTAGTKTGVKAFNTITKVTIPAMDGNGATVSVGVGAALGLPDTLSRDTVLASYLDGAREASRPTPTIDADEVEKNVITPVGSLNGAKDFVVDYYTGGQ